jgi:hypothetical protein
VRHCSCVSWSVRQCLCLSWSVRARYALLYRSFFSFCLDSELFQNSKHYTVSSLQFSYYVVYFYQNWQSKCNYRKVTKLRYVNWTLYSSDNTIQNLLKLVIFSLVDLSGQRAFACKLIGSYFELFFLPPSWSAIFGSFFEIVDQKGWYDLLSTRRDLWGREWRLTWVFVGSRVAFNTSIAFMA